MARIEVVDIIFKSDLGFLCDDVDDWTIDGRLLTPAERTLVETSTRQEWDVAEQLAALDQDLTLTVPPWWV